ncbi:MAG: helix-turn-helix domain-containing protein [Methylocystaceae bacterium]
MNDLSFGQFLRQVREDLGLTLDQAEEATKIRKFYLRALEEDNFSVMPAQVYAIGFVRKYCVFLGLDEHEMIQRYKQLSGGTRHEEEAPVVTSTPYQEKPPFISRVSTKNLAAGLIFLVIILWLGSYVSDYMARRASDNEQNAINKTQVNTQKPSNQNEQKPPTKPQKEAQEVSVIITGTASCWYSVQVDDGSAEQGMLANGDTKEYHGKEKIALRLGNAGGAKVSVNGKEATYLGGSGEVVTQEYTINQ